MFHPIAILYNSCKILHSEYSKNPPRFFAISIGCFFTNILALGLAKKINAKIIIPSLICSFTIPHFAMHFFSAEETLEPLPKASPETSEDESTEEIKSSDEDTDSSEEVSGPPSEDEDESRKRVRFPEGPYQLYEYPLLTPEPSPPSSPKPKPKRLGSLNLGPALRVSQAEQPEDDDE